MRLGKEREPAAKGGIRGGIMPQGGVERVWSSLIINCRALRAKEGWGRKRGTKTEGPEVKVQRCW